MRVIKTVAMLLAVAGLAVSVYAVPLTYNEPDEFSHEFDGWSVSIDPGYTKVWWFSTVKVRWHAAGEDPDVDGTDAAAFYVNDDGELMAYNGENFAQVGTATVPADTYVKFAVRLDYDNHVYDVYMANPPTAPLVKQNSTPLVFNNDTLTEIAAVAITGDLTQKDVTIEATGVPIIPDTPSPPNIGTATLVIAGDASAVSFQYLGVQSGTLAGDLGGALEPLFSAAGDGDQLHFWDAAAQVSRIATRGDLGWGGTAVTSGLTITPTTGAFIYRRSGETLSRSTTVAYTSTQTPSGSTTIEPGWNLLAVPSTSTGKKLSTSGLPAEENDYVFLWTGNSWAISRYRLSVEEELEWSEDLTLPTGVTFWLRSASGGSWAW